jgi:hypothetical protein
MMPIDLPVMDAEILTRVVVPTAPTLSEESARQFLEMRFSESDIARMDELAAKNRGDGLSEAEQGELASFLRVGFFLDLVQAKSIVSLRHRED